MVISLVDIKSVAEIYIGLREKLGVASQYAPWQNVPAGVRRQGVGQTWLLNGYADPRIKTDFERYSSGITSPA
ncbi:MAG TPA: hypothetical protein VMV48_09190 [Gallionellaceae bacterium]|nr:hypothetical protein [Gallionellaceae bacterium]